MLNIHMGFRFGALDIRSRLWMGRLVIRASTNAFAHELTYVVVAMKGLKEVPPLVTRAHALTEGSKHRRCLLCRSGARGECAHEGIPMQSSHCFSKSDEFGCFAIRDTVGTTGTTE